MKTLAQVEKILSEQIGKISEKSREVKLSAEEVDTLAALTKIQLEIIASAKRAPYKPRTRPYDKGDRVTDEDLLGYAADKEE